MKGMLFFAMKTLTKKRNRLTYSTVQIGWVLLYVHRNRRFIRDGNP